MTQTTREELLAQRKRLQARLDAIKADYANGLDPDSGERAVQLENAETLEEIQKVTKEELIRVEALLEN